jgi:hypothetical protein
LAIIHTLDNNHNHFSNRLRLLSLSKDTSFCILQQHFFASSNIKTNPNIKMSARLIQFGLLSLIGSAIAIPVFPTGSYDAGNSTEGEFKGPTGTGQAHGTGRHHHGARPRPSGSGSLTMEAIPTTTAIAAAAAASGVDTSVAVAAVDGETTTDCSTETFYATTTSFMTVYVSPTEVAPVVADSTIFASSVVPSSAPAAEAPVASSSVAAAAATYSAPAAEAPVASPSTVSQAIGKFSFSNTAVVAPSSTPVAAVASSSVVAPVAAAPATSAKATATAAATSSSTIGGKRGIAYNSPALAKLLIGKSQWAYNWGSTNGGLASGVEYLPMLWGATADKTNTWVKDATAGIAAGATALLGFNEPDHTEQANMSPQAAATAYKQYITNNFAGKAKLISPAVTNGGGSMGLAWLSSFMGLCSDCQIDAVAIHWYDSSSNVEYFKSHIQDAHTQSGKPVYLTEFGTTDGNDQAFLAAVLPWLDSQDYVQKYAYFMASDGKLISGSGLSAAGNTYCT